MCTENNKLQTNNDFELLHGNFSWKCTGRSLQIDLSCKASQQKNATPMSCEVSVQKENRLTRRSGSFFMLVCLFVCSIASEVWLHSLHITIEGHFLTISLIYNCTILRLYILGGSCADLSYPFYNWRQDNVAKQTSNGLLGCCQCIVFY